MFFALQFSWIQLLPCISSDEYGWYPICSPPLSPYRETVIILLLSFSLLLFFFPQEKNKTRKNFCLGGKKSFTIFLFFLMLFSLFPLSFSIFHVDLSSHLSFSCVLAKGWARSSFLIYSFIFENKNDDWLLGFFSPLIVYLLVHTCFFHSGFLQVLARILSCSAFCFSFLLRDYAGPTGPPSPPFRAASPGLAASPPAPREDFVAWLSGPRCRRGAGDALLLFRFSHYSGIRFQRECDLHRFISGSALSITKACRKQRNDYVAALGLSCIKQRPLTYFQNERAVYKNHGEEKWYSCS